MTVPALEAAAWPAFGAAAAVAAILVLWYGRDTSFTLDETLWFAEAPGLGLGDALEPHNGHLVFISKLVYKGLLEAGGADYWPFRLLSLACVIAAAALFFHYASRRIGRLAAFAPTLILLVFGSDEYHALAGNGITVLLALILGLGAMLALERREPRWDAIACLALVVGAATYTVALPFVVAAAIAIALAREWRRMWVPLVPAVAYGVWWLATRGSDGGASEVVDVANLLLVPAWAFSSLGAVLEALTGLNYSFGESSANAAGALALVALAALAWRLRRGRVPVMLWAALGAALALWTLGALASGPTRGPDHSRYMYPGAYIVLFAAVWAAAGARWSPRHYIVLYLVAAAGVMTNVALLREGGESLRVLRATLAGQLAAGDVLGPDRVPPSAYPAIDEGNQLDASLARFAHLDPAQMHAYANAATRYGPVTGEVGELSQLDELARGSIDANLVGAGALAWRPATPAEVRRACARGQTAGRTELVIAPGESAVIEAPAEATLRARRFADLLSAPVGTLPAGRPTVLAPPADRAGDPWLVTSSVSLSRVCAS